MNKKVNQTTCVLFAFQNILKILDKNVLIQLTMLIKTDTRLKCICVEWDQTRCLNMDHTKCDKPTLTLTTAATGSTCRKMLLS
jgi:ssRNA-specific RNase YbeY (16S rRNA maturation enzyme)